MFSTNTILRKSFTQIGAIWWTNYHQVLKGNVHTVSCNLYILDNLRRWFAAEDFT